MQPLLQPRALDVDFWTIDDLDALPEGLDWRRCQIVDGALVVSPAPALLHEYVCEGLRAALRPTLPRDLALLGSIGIDLAPSYLIPDAAVVPMAVFGEHRTNARAADVLLAVEVVSPGSVTTDRITKPAQYAAAGIPNFWRVETEPVSLTAYELDDNAYREVGTWGPGEIAHVARPFEVEIVIDDLVPPPT